MGTGWCQVLGTRVGGGKWSTKVENAVAANRMTRRVAMSRDGNHVVSGSL